MWRGHDLLFTNTATPRTEPLRIQSTGHRSGTISVTEFPSKTDNAVSNDQWILRNTPINSGQLSRHRSRKRDEPRTASWLQKSLNRYANPHVNYRFRMRPSKYVILSHLNSLNIPLPPWPHTRSPLTYVFIRFQSHAPAASNVLATCFGP